MSVIELPEKIQTLRAKPVVKKQRQIEYPSEDGKRMAETPKHGQNIVDTSHALNIKFVDRDDVYIIVDGLLYWHEGYPRERVSPDICVIFGVVIDKNNPPNSWLAWKHGHVLPNIVFEFTSLATKGNDEKSKFKIYEQIMQVPEYVQFDPIGGLLNPRLIVWRLVKDSYIRVKEEAQGIYSEQLGLYLQMVDGKLRLFDPIKKQLLPTAALSEQMRQEEYRLRQEATRMAQEEYRLRQEEYRLRQAETQRAEEAILMAQSERQKVKELEAELERLKIRFESLAQ